MTAPVAVGSTSDDVDESPQDVPASPVEVRSVLTRRELREAASVAGPRAIVETVPTGTAGATDAAAPVRLTRRELRASEQGAKAARPSSSENVVAAGRTPVADAALAPITPITLADVPTAPAEVMAAISTRRELRSAPARSTRPARGTGGSFRRARSAASRHRRPLLRASVVLAAAAVGVIGVSIPLVQQQDAAADAHSASVPQVAALSAPTFSVLSDAQQSAVRVAPELLATGDAGARADYAAASRSDVRADLRCSSDVAASGARAALADQEVAVMPVAAGTYRLSSGYGSRIHPITGRYTFHTGDDFAAPYGTPIYAVADGVVTHAGPGIEGRSGTLVIIEHDYQGQTFETWSTHMAPSGVHVGVGDTVRAGEHVADVGSWGNSTGPHLHLEVHVGGETVAPIAYLESVGAIDVSETC